MRFEHDGAITVLAESFQGKQLNSPNDVVVKSDGSIWFTDPPFGTYAFYEGIKCRPSCRIPMSTASMAEPRDHPGRR